jgi:hypothetical protein
MFHDICYLAVGALIGWHVPKPNWAALFAKVKAWFVKEVPVVVADVTNPPVPPATTPPAV